MGSGADRLDDVEDTCEICGGFRRSMYASTSKIMFGKRYCGDCLKKMFEFVVDKYRTHKNKERIDL